MRLKDKKERERAGRYLIEGYRAVRDSLPYVKNPRLLIGESAYPALEKEFSSWDIAVCSDRILSAAGDTATAQGILMSAEIPSPEKTYAAERALLLDRVRDPGNMGTIIRTALAAGFDDIYCLNCADAYNPKVVRSAMSALARVNILVCDDGEAERIKAHGYTLVAADMDGKNVFSGNFSQKKLCLAIGNEANGLDKSIITMSDIVLSIPMKAGESLNAAVSASILMYQLSTIKG